MYIGVWWSPPARFIKCNFNGSKLDNADASFGCIIWDHSGKVVLMGAKYLHTRIYIFVAEAWGLTKRN